MGKFFGIKRCLYDIGVLTVQIMEIFDELGLIFDIAPELHDCLTPSVIRGLLNGKWKKIEQKTCLPCSEEDSGFIKFICCGGGVDLFLVICFEHLKKKKRR
jgi:hypothetical protein